MNKEASTRVIHKIENICQVKNLGIMASNTPSGRKPKKLSNQTLKEQMHFILNTVAPMQTI